MTLVYTEGVFIHFCTSDVYVLNPKRDFTLGEWD